MSKNLGDNYMLSELNLKCPPGTARNKKLEAEAEAKHGITANDRVRSVVDYFNTDALKEVRKLHTKLRNKHIQVTLPWAERGPRLTENSQVRDFRAEVDAVKIEAGVKWEHFKVDLENHKARDRQALGTLFDESMYPTLEDLAGRHSIEVVFTVVPDADHDVRAGWDTETKDKFQADTQKMCDARVAQAQKVMAKRCYDFVERVHDRMSHDGGKVGAYNDSLIPNVKDMIEMCGLFNVNDDPEIKGWISDMSSQICIYSTQELRDGSATMRQEVGKAAGKLAERIKTSNIGAFGKPPSLPTDDR